LERFALVHGVVEGSAERYALAPEARAAPRNANTMEACELRRLRGAIVEARAWLDFPRLLEVVCRLVCGGHKPQPRERREANHERSRGAVETVSAIPLRLRSLYSYLRGQLRLRR